MDDPRAARLVQTALRCYPARWRRRHGGEATELARELGREALAEQAEWLLVRRTQPLAMVETPAITN